MSELDRARRAHRLMKDALALPEAERGRFLREQCGDDTALIARVRQLLATARKAEDYFDGLGDDVGRVLERTTEQRVPAATEAVREPPPPLTVGDTIGHFRITGELGSGGMGTVYRATDLRLGRDVAIKVLPESVARDSELAARFEQEARLLAALSHTNIASIFGIHEDGERRVLVLQLIDGPDLDQRIRRRRMSIRESLEVAAQIARALDAAHRAGIVHRDLKPSNVKIESDSGLVKVLDFGIATVLPHAREESSPGAGSPVTTQPGRILGTVAYMSPEQARGEAVDERADIWAWGCVLFEMLAGERPFGGRTVTDTLAAIIEREPDWSRLPATTPAEIVRTLRRCLRKDARRRPRNAGDVWLTLDELMHPAGDQVLPAAPVAAGGWRRALPWALAAVAALAGGQIGRAWLAVPANPVRLEIHVRGDQLRTAVGGRTIAITDDGTALAYTVDGRLSLRPLDAFESREIPGAIGAESPAFSPDGEWLAYFSRGSLRKISLRGGEAFALCAAALPRGADWGADDRIVFSDGTALWTVDGYGGDCVRLRAPDSADRRFVWPVWLPGQERVLFQANGPSGSSIAVLDTLDGAVVTLPLAGTDPRYTPTGHLLFTRLGTLFATSFDWRSLRLGETPRPVLDGVQGESTGASHLALSQSGVLAYAPDPNPQRQVVWVEPDGSATPAIGAAADYSTPRVAPDGSRIAVVVRRAGERNVWIHDLDSGTTKQLTEGLTSIWPDWSPDGSKLTFSSARGGPAVIWWLHPDGGPATRLSTEGRHQYASAWAAATDVVAWFQIGLNGTRDIWVQAVGDGGESLPAVTTPAHEQGPALSPDGRWIAYAANTTGRNEVYVEACAACRDDPSGAPSRRWRVSLDGGGEALWAPGGDRLYYRAGTRVMAVDLRLVDGAIRPEAPVELFRGPYVIGESGNPNWDVAPDGSRFLMIQSPDSGTGHTIRVDLSWLAGLGER